MNWKMSLPLTRLPVIIILLLLVAAGCGKNQTGDEAPAHEELLKTIRQTCSAIGIDFSADSGESARDSDLVTLKNVVVSTDTSALKDLRAGVMFKSGTLPIQMKEIVFNYKPSENYLGLISIKGMDLHWQFKIPDSKTSSLSEIKLSADDILYDEHNVSPLLASKAATGTELLIELFSSDTAMKSTTKDMVYELNFVGEKGKKLSFHMEFSEIRGSQNMNPDIFLGLYTKKEKDPPDFNNILDQGSPVFDINLVCAPLKVIYKADGLRLGGGELDGLSFGYFLKPDNSRKFFTYGMNMEIKNMNVSTTGNDALSILSRVKELKADLSVVKLSAGFAQAYFDLMKKSAELNQKANPDAIRKAQAAMGMKIFMEFMKSKPGLKFSISPFIHELGEMEAHGKFRFSGISIPSGKAKLKIKNANELLNTLRNAKDLPPLISQVLVKTLTGILKINDEGDGLLVFETREKFPGQFFINGKAIRK